MRQRRNYNTNNSFINTINKIDKSINEIKNKMNKKPYEKIYIWIGIIVGIFGILESGGKFLLDNKEDHISQELIEKEKYYKGTITKTGWDSKFIGLRYTNPDGMIMLTEDELDELNEFKSGTPSIIYNQNELGQIKLTTVIEMMSISNDNSIIAGVCAERLIDKIDISHAIANFELQMNQNPFYNYELISDDETVKIGNIDYIMVSYMVSFNNEFRYQDSYFRVVGDRLIMISFNYNDERERDKVLNAFTAY